MRHSMHIFSRPLEQPQINLWFGWSSNPSRSIPTPPILEHQEIKHSHIYDKEEGQETDNKEQKPQNFSNQACNNNTSSIGRCWSVAGDREGGIARPPITNPGMILHGKWQPLRLWIFFSFSLNMGVPSYKKDHLLVLPLKICVTP